MKLKVPSLVFKKPDWKLDFHSMTILPMLMLAPVSIFASMALSDLEMASLSYLVFGLFLISFALIFYLYCRDGKMSKYGFVHLLFFGFMISITAMNDRGDLKNGIYVAMEVLFFLMMLFYYKDRIHVVIIGTAIAFSFCVYANLLHLLSHPDLWIIDEDKANTGYLLGNNYNGMGVRMIVAIAFSTICIRYSKWWILNFIGVVIASYIPLIITGSKTSLAGVSLFLIVSILPYKRIQKGISNIALIFFILFQCLVVFSGKGLENNRLAVYIIEDVLEKDITFTFRTYLWDMAIKKIAESPIWGYGFANLDWYASYIRISAGTGPHNMILSILVNGGIILLCIYVGICFMSLKRVFPYNDRYAIIIRMAVITIMIMLLMEMQSYVFVMYLLALAFYYPYIKEEKKLSPAFNG